MAVYDDPLFATRPSTNYRQPELDHFYWPPGITTAYTIIFLSGPHALYFISISTCQLWFSGSYALWFLGCLDGMLGTVKSTRASDLRLWTFGSRTARRWLMMVFIQLKHAVTVRGMNGRYIRYRNYSTLICHGNRCRHH